MNTAKRRGHWKTIPAMRNKRSAILIAEKERELFHNDEFWKSIDQTLAMTDMKTTEQLVIKILDDLKYEEVRPARRIWTED